MARFCIEWGFGAPDGVTFLGHIHGLSAVDKIAGSRGYGKLPWLEEILFRICCTKMTRTCTRLATSGRNSASRLFAGSMARPVAMRSAVEAPSDWMPGT